MTVNRNDGVVQGRRPPGHGDISVEAVRGYGSDFAQAEDGGHARYGARLGRPSLPCCPRLGLTRIAAHVDSRLIVSPGRRA